MISAGAGELFQLLRDGKPRTRTELVEETGLARTSVVNRLAALSAAGLVASTGTTASSGGRPATRIMFDPGTRVCVGVDLGATHGSVGVLDLAGQVLLEESRVLDIATGPVEVLSWVASTVEKLLAEGGHKLHDLLGVGVGVPGPVEHSTGRPIRPPIMPGWDGFDIPGFLSERLAAPVLVDNDVNLLALGERATQWPAVDDLLFIKVATGIGAGIIVGGSLQRGSRGSAGDIGHVQVPGIADDRDLEVLAGAPAIAASLSLNGDIVAPGDVMERVRTGDPIAIAAAREAGRAIGKVTATCVSILNPSVVVIGGQLGINVQEIIAGIREVVYQRSIPLATQHLNIVPARGGSNAGIRGAALMVLEDRLSAETVDKLVATK
jgi:predicted NBD/HSP70 family sugar kinase